VTFAVSRGGVPFSHGKNVAAIWIAKIRELARNTVVSRIHCLILSGTPPRGDGRSGLGIARQLLSVARSLATAFVGHVVMLLAGALDGHAQCCALDHTQPARRTRELPGTVITEADRRVTRGCRRIRRHPVARRCQQMRVVTERRRSAIPRMCDVGDCCDW
jgi:hypothetical protein